MSDSTATGLSSDLHGVVSRRVDELRGRLVGVSRSIFANPELAFEEHASAELLASEAEELGFTVERGAYGVPTSFRAEYGDGDFVVVVCAEYDALPGIGHACGHNVIAGASLGAAAALAEVADSLGLRVVLLGTPAEEAGGGKTVLLERGAWKDATISLMAHPKPGTADRSCRYIGSKAVERFQVTFHGRAAHAAVEPEAGINAADAASIALVALGLLRQQFAEPVRANAYVVEAGLATNIIAARSVVQVEVRADDNLALDDVKRRILACFDGAAIATGCSWEWVETDPRYESLLQEPALAAAWDESLRAVGRVVIEAPELPGGSTDMGNVSHAVPSIHPHIAIIGSSGIMHSTFVHDANSPASEDALVDAAKALAMSVVTVAANPQTRSDLLARQLTNAR